MLINRLAGNQQSICHEIQMHINIAIYYVLLFASIVNYSRGSEFTLLGSGEICGKHFCG